MLVPALILAVLTATADARPAPPVAGVLETQLEARLEAALARRGKARGQAGVVVLHVETGRVAAVAGDQRLPMQSVVKLPIAAAVLDDVARGKTRLDQTLRVTPADLAPGPDWMVARWKDLPRQVTVRELLEGAIVWSDSTSSNLLLGLTGGPAGLSRKLAAWGLADLEVRAPYGQQDAAHEHPNRGSARAFSALLRGLQRRELLPEARWRQLRGWMEQSTTGARRLRAGVPPGTVVADRTGTGGGGATTNDVGLITLPARRGHLAVSVLLSGWTSPLPDQEALIADLARLAYDAWAR